MGEDGVKSRRIKLYSESLAPSSLYIGRAELVPSMSPELMETGPLAIKIIVQFDQNWKINNRKPPKAKAEL